MLEEARSDLETEVEKYEKQMKQLEILLSDIEQFTKVHFHIIYSYFVHLRACMSGYMRSSYRVVTVAYPAAEHMTVHNYYIPYLE